MILQFALCNLHFALERSDIPYWLSPIAEVKMQIEKCKMVKVLQFALCNLHFALERSDIPYWLSLIAKVKMQIGKCKIEAICQDGYQSSQDDFAICTLQFAFCTGAKRQ